MAEVKENWAYLQPWTESQRFTQQLQLARKILEAQRDSIILLPSDLAAELVSPPSESVRCGCVGHTGGSFE
ncbi:hypothetical protein F1880_006315 [Penicillium rolfsii]|nr:hypothetical protein F1880_006315 [Penicillium rolfsii]